MVSAGLIVLLRTELTNPAKQLDVGPHHGVEDATRVHLDMKQSMGEQQARGASLYVWIASRLQTEKRVTSKLDPLAHRWRGESRGPEVG